MENKLRKIFEPIKRVWWAYKVRDTKRNLRERNRELKLKNDNYEFYIGIIEKELKTTYSNKTKIETIEINLEYLNEAIGENNETN